MSEDFIISVVVFAALAGGLAVGGALCDWLDKRAHQKRQDRLVKRNWKMK
jgi:hypothetical protein